MSTRITSPQPNVWSDATGEMVTGKVVEHYIAGCERPISRTTEDEAEGEPDRIRMGWHLGLEQGGYSLHRVTNEGWPGIYMFDGYQDGMNDGGLQDDCISIVGFGYPVTTDFPDELVAPEDDFGDTDRYKLVKVYNMSPESECAWCGTGTGNEDSRDGCALCEGDGLLYEPYHRVAIYHRQEEED
jgi:hypothetical protein